METIDETDLRILQLLQDNAQLTSKELSGHLNLSLSPIYERIRRLEKSGIIQNYVTILDRSKLGYDLVAYCHVSLKEHARPLLKKFEEDVLHFQEVLECHHVTGNFDYMLKVCVKDMKSYQDFIVNKLASLANIGNAQSQFVLSTIRESTALPL
ncbi:MAG TPA: Lrp/AsnC family transcriptional regulator [Saprospiraceae bacterium]|nr:Lrp/AsnC family transcriptional regulator [Saprospiraceae bacterium]